MRPIDVLLCICGIRAIHQHSKPKVDICQVPYATPKRSMECFLDGVDALGYTAFYARMGAFCLGIYEYEYLAIKDSRDWFLVPRRKGAPALFVSGCYLEN